jgi:hypothetical protein
MFPLVKIVKDQSEHNLLLLNSNESKVETKNREFIFDLTWFKNLDFLPLVQKLWEKLVNSLDPIDVINIKLKRFKKHCKGWGG